MSGLPDRISMCWQNRGYHAMGAGPCFDTIEEAVAYRDRELQRIGQECDRKADRTAFFDEDLDRHVTWREHWDATGWPDGRKVALRV
jgi:hypothetical protein